MAKKTSYKDELVAEIERLSQSNGLNTVFTTFLEITAVSIAAQMDPANAAEREKRYEEIASKMEPETLSSYTRMFALLYMAILEHADDPCDILGDIYHKLRLNNEWNGQFFTPDHISRLMAQLLNPVEVLRDKEMPITINEPTCGSGTMIIGAIWAMKRKDFDYHENCFFVAQDIDIRCVWMTYIQMSMYKIPGVVIHGNTLTMEEWSRWYTPYARLSFMKEFFLEMQNNKQKGVAQNVCE